MSCLSSGHVDIKFVDKKTRIAAFNMRDGYDMYPLSGMLPLVNECDRDPSRKICPVAFDPISEIVWGSWQVDKIRAWSTRSGRVLAEGNHGTRVTGLKVWCFHIFSTWIEISSHYIISQLFHVKEQQVYVVSLSSNETRSLLHVWCWMPHHAPTKQPLTLVAIVMTIVSPTTCTHSIFITHSKLQ